MSVGPVISSPDLDLILPQARRILMVPEGDIDFSLLEGARDPISRRLIFLT
jgi:hypothetical protein